MPDLNIIKNEIKRPITRYMVILYLVTLFSQLIYFRENNILPSVAKYDFFLILNYLKEISIAIIIYFFSIVIFELLRDFTYYKKISPYFYWGDLFAVALCIYFFCSIGVIYSINEYLRNWDIIFLCIFLSLTIEVSQYLSKKTRYEDQYLDYENKSYSENYKNLCEEKSKYEYLVNRETQSSIYRSIICSMVVAVGLIYIKNKL